MSDLIWNVRIQKSYVDLDFQFESSDKAVAFSRTAAKTYKSDEEKLTVFIQPMFAEDVTEEKEDNE